MLAFELSLQLILLIFVGFFVWRRNLVDEKFDNSLTSFIMNIALPCLIVKSFDAPYSAQELKNCVILVIISLVLLGFSFLIGQLIYRFSGGGHVGRILRFGTMFPNFSFVGMPVVEALYGQTGLLYFAIFLLPVRLVYYSAAKPLLSPAGAKGEAKGIIHHLKSFLSPPILAVFVGLALYISGFKLPGFLDKTISGLGSVCSPMGMVLCGITLGKGKLSQLLSISYLRLPLIRNIMFPAITMAVMYFVPVDPLVSKIVIIYSALPVAAMLTAFTIEYSPEPQARLESAGGVLLSVLLSAVTIPLWAYLVERLF